MPKQHSVLVEGRHEDAEWQKLPDKPLTVGVRDADRKWLRAEATKQKAARRRLF